MVAIGLGILLGTIDASIVNVALPTLSTELEASFAAVQWVVLAYLLTVSTMSLGMGRLGDMLGKRRIYTVGFVVFTIGSVLAGLAPTVLWLIGFRVLQALGSSMIFALSMAIVTESFPPAERGRALGISGALVSMGIVLGPTLGGLIIQQWSWRWIFFVNLPIGIIGAVAAWRFVPDVPPPGRQRFDYPGAAVFFGALLTTMLGLSLAQTNGFRSVSVVGLLGLGLVGGVGFVAIERRVSQPMLDLRLFENRLLSINLITAWLTFFAISGIFLLFPFYLEDVLGFDPRAVGLLLAPAPVLLGLVAPISGTVSDRIGSRRVVVVGLGALVIAYGTMQLISVNSPWWIAIVVLGPVGLGMGIFQSPNNSAVMGAVPPHRLGVTAALLSITRNTGQLTGVAVLGAVWALRVTHFAGGTVDIRSAPAAAQVAALRDVGWLNTVIMLIAFALSIWGLAEERRSNRRDQSRAIRSVSTSK